MTRTHMRAHIAERNRRRMHSEETSSSSEQSASESAHNARARDTTVDTSYHSAQGRNSEYSQRQLSSSSDEHNIETRESSDNISWHNRQTGEASEAPRKASFTEKVKGLYSRGKSVASKTASRLVGRREKRSSSGFDNPPDKARRGTSEKRGESKLSKAKRAMRSRLPGNVGAGYTSVLGSQIHESAVPGSFVDPFEGEREVMGYGRSDSPLRLSMGSPPPPDMGYGSPPPPYMPMGFPSPEEMMGMGSSRTSRKRRR